MSTGQRDAPGDDQGLLAHSPQRGAGAFSEPSFVTRVLDALPFPVSYLDQDLVYRLCNTAAAATVGRTPETVIGSTAQSVIGEDSEVIALLRSVLDSGQPYSGVLDFTTPGSSETSTYRVSYVPDIDEQGRVLGVLTDVVDMTELARTQRKAQKELERVLLLQDVTTAATSSLSLPEIGERVLSLARERLGAASAVIYALDPSSSELHSLASFGYPQDIMRGIRTLRVDDETAMGHLVANDLPILTHETDYLPPASAKRARRLPEEVRWLALPIRGKRGPVGTVSLLFQGNRPFADDEVSLYRSFCELLGSAFERARLFEAESEARQVASDELNAANILLHAASELNQYNDLSGLLDALVRLVLRLIPGGRVNIGLAAEDKSSMAMAASGGQRPYPCGAIVPWDKLTSGARGALETGRTSIVDFEQLEEGGIANEYGSRLALFVALKFGNRTVGQMGMDVPDQRYDFTPRVIALVEGIASQAAAAIDNVRLVEDSSSQAERAEALKELAEIGLTGVSVNDVAERQAQAIVRLLGASNAAVALSDGERLQPVALLGYPDEYIEKLTPLPEDALAAQAFRSGEARFVTDVHAADTSEFTRTVSSALGFGSFAALPLGPLAAPIGAVGLGWRETRLFDRDEVSFLEAVTSELSLGLSNQRAQDELRESEEQFRSLAESIPNLAWWANADGYITWYNRRWYDYTDTTPEQMEGWGWQSVHDPEVLLTVLERWTASIATGEPFEMEFPLRGADGVFRTFLTRVEPLNDSSGHVVRWFGTNTDISSIKATEDRLRTLVDAEKESARLSAALNDVNGAVHSTLEIDEVMQHALEAGVQVLGCDAGTIEMRERAEWVVRYEAGFSAEDVGMRLSEAEAPNATRAALEEHPLAIEDMSRDETIDVGFVRKHGLKSVLAVPLHVRGDVSGCALFYTSTAKRHFTDAEVDFGRKLGSAVSLGLENARLYAVERNTAQTLQRALLTMPESLRGIEFANSYRAATESTLVGGDFYDLFELDDDHIGITIGDISGKGLGAAVLTSLVKGTIRAHANERMKTPAEVLTLTNDLVYKFTPTESFATVFFGILDRRGGGLCFANSGHTTAVILKSGGETQRLPVTDPILGAFAHVEYGESEARVEFGEILFLYTDGLTEARRGMEMYGEERLLALLSSAKVDSAEDAVEEALVDVLTFSEGRLRDDLAILALRRLGAVGE